MPKPKKNTKPFIDKKNAQSFHIVHRSQRDPRAADDDAPQHLLQPILSKEEQKKRKEEEKEYGVFFDDDYDYMQHMKSVDDIEVELEPTEVVRIERPQSIVPENVKANLNLPESVFPSTEEEDIGLLNKAAPHYGPRPDWDPEIVAGLDDDFDYENEDNILEDDFMAMANAEGEGIESGDDEEYSDVDSDFGGYGRSSDEEDDDVPDLDGRFDEEETRSRFTNYSMSSSVIKRNDNLTLVDDKFEKFYEEYDDDNLGALDCEEIEGFREADPEENEILKYVLKDFEKNQKEERTKLDIDNSVVVEEEEEESSDDEYELVEVDANPKREFDAETIISTYSNKYNHPKLIKEPSKKDHDRIQISGKTGMPKDVLGRGGLTARGLKLLDRENAELDDETCTITSHISELSFRNKHETVEEKRDRKKAFKEMKRERRMEKKANKTAFKEEKDKQEKIMMNKRTNVQGKKLL